MQARRPADELIIEALTKLLQKKEFSAISVKDIVSCCGISRQTFYRHFQDKFEVVEHIFAEDVTAYQQIYGKNALWYSACITHLRKMRQRRSFYSKILNDDWALETFADIAYQEAWTKDYSLRKTDELSITMQPQRLGKSILSQNLCKWCKNGCVMSPEEMFDVMIQSLPASFILEPDELASVKYRLKQKTVKDIKTYWEKQSQQLFKSCSG